MKTIRNLLLFVGTALFLAACGTGGNGGGDGDQNGTLRFALSGVDSAAVEVFRGSDSVFDEVVEDGDTTTLAAGDYSVVAGAVAGYEAPAAVNVTVVAGQTATAALNYTAEGSDNGPGDGNGEEPETEPGLYVSLNPFSVRDADTTVTVTEYASGDVVATSDGTGELFYELEPGLYVVTAERDGYGTVSREVEHGDGVTTVSITLVSDADAGIPGGNVAPGSVTFSYIDANGYPFASLKENNPEKDVDLLAAQTEDRICVTVSTGVANAIVDVDITNTRWNSVAIVDDKCAEEVELTAASSRTRSFEADANGDVQFSLFSTNATPWFDLLDEIGLREPIKIVVSARGADGVADISEFKVFFVNMSHLYFGHGETADDPYDMVEEAIEDWLDNPSQQMDPRVHTGQRWGRDFGLLTNIWGNTPSNAHYFGTGAAQKQPFNFGYFGEGEGWVHQDFGGRVVYSVSGDDAGNVAWVSGEDEDCAIVEGDCVISGDGEVAQLAPVSGLSLDDLPFQVDVTATYYHDVVYGPFTYSFPLKQYTVSKQWVSGYLEVDKYVTQHVLTWYGEDVTLPRTSANVPEQYTSTVVINVSNPSQAPMYNITVTDSLPAELGVVEGSISAPGTYNAATHTITWNNALDPYALEAGEALPPFTFDVYARQKPGYCWDGAGTYAVGPINPVIEDDCDAPYEDPYVVTNGSAPNSVSAAAYFTESVVGQDQHVYYYRPAADESDIWVVRPFFEIAKELISSPRMLINGAADFRISASQINRLSSTVDDGNTEYAFLATLYPWEFDWFGAADGVRGHRAPESVERNNPYAHDVTVTDIFEVGLDFTQATDFDGSLVFDSSTQVVGNEFTFSMIPSLHPDGTEVVGEVKLQGVLLSDDGDGISENGAAQTVNVNGVDYFAWMNCTFLNAAQLNQPAEGAGFGDTVYSTDNYTGGLWYGFDQIVNIPADDEADPPVIGEYSGPEFVSPADETLTGPDGSIYACAEVAVTPPEPEPFIGINVNGEHPTATYTDPNNTGPQVNSYDVGDTWTYLYALDNDIGGAAATDVVMTFTQTRAATRFVTSPAPTVWRSPNGIAAWTPVPAAEYTLVANTSTNIEIVLDEVDAGEFILVAIEGRAIQSGQGRVEFTADYGNRVSQPDIDTTIDTTQVR